MPDSSAAAFRTTRWSLVLRAQGSGTELDQLLRLYWRPVYAWLRRQRRSRHDASDLTQSFICDVVLARDLLAKAEKGRGRFRSYLLTALSRFLIDEHRHRTASTRAPATPVRSLDAPAFAHPERGRPLLDAAEPSPTDDPVRAFERQWATTVIELALERFERKCVEEGLDAQHTAFMLNVVAPATRGSKSQSLEALAKSLGLSDWTKAGSTIQTAKRRFRRELERVVLETLEDPRDLADELRAIRDALKQ
ncbi:MAG: sigma-70 family RNA polymerase sigma factor [Phycisphaeraceae bacterium]|nr:MAG: sigma-70 family RNA polymerase sigma factor [Phycisphaeraceae bacterium]